MADGTVLWERVGRLGSITLNRPEKLNAFSQPLLREFDAVLDEARRDREVRVIIIRGVAPHRRGKFQPP